MSFVKKWISTIMAFVAGICGLALSACTGMVASGYIDMTALGAKKETIDSTTKAFKVLTDSDLYTEAKELGIGSEFMLMKVFAIITLVVSVLLIIYAIVMLLKNLNVVKFESKVFTIVGLSLFGLLLVSTIGLLITSNNYANAMEDAMTGMFKLMLVGQGVPENVANGIVNINIKVGAYQPIMLVVAIVSALAVSTFTFINRKQA